MSGLASLATVEPMLTTTPGPERSAGIASRISAIGAITLVENAPQRSWSEALASGPRGYAPALLTSTSRPPSALVTASMMRADAPGRDTSPGTARPRSPSSRATSSSRSARRPPTATLAPAAANARAIARPMPVPPPVTRTARPSNFMPHCFPPRRSRQRGALGHHGCMRIGVHLSIRPSKSLDRLIDQVRRLEQRGFGLAWIDQVYDYEALSLAAVLGRETEHIALGTWVVPTYPRHPSVLAQQALTVHAASRNRLVLGLRLAQQ